MNSNNYEMATPINSLKNQNTNINNLVRNVENNIETLNNTSNVPMSAPQPIINQPPHTILIYLFRFSTTNSI